MIFLAIKWVSEILILPENSSLASPPVQSSDCLLTAQELLWMVNKYCNGIMGC